MNRNYGVKMNKQLTVRPLKRGEEILWTSIGVPQGEVESRCQKLINYLARNPSLPPENYLLAFSGETLVGKMSGIVESTGYIATNIYVIEIAGSKAITEALLAYVKRFGRLQALSWARDDNRSWRNLLKESGFVEKEDKSYYRRKIAHFVSPFENRFQLVSLQEIGESSFLEIYNETYSGNLNRNFNNDFPESDFRSNIESAGNLFDPCSWYVVLEKSSPVGILLPQRFPDSTHDGTLMCVGLLPFARGRGYGKILHAKGMEILASQGATDYIGSTDVQNLPMKKVFEKNGCELIGIRTTHERV
jgi:ribosomal protein S18 acetylase RimI-like enzyme